MKINSSYIPQRFIIGYLIVTFLMYIFSPWNWPKNNLSAILLFNSMIWLSIYLGFRRGFHSKFVARRQINGPLYKTKLWNISLFISILFIYPNFIVRFQEDSISFANIYQRLLIAVSDLKEAYFTKAESELKDTSVFSNIWIFIYTILGPLVYFVKFYGIYFWKKLYRYQRVVIALVIFTDILAFVATGTNKGIFDYILNIPFFVVLYLQGKQKMNTISISFKYVRNTLFLLLVGIVFFGMTYQSRTRDKAMLYNFITGKTISYDTGLASVLPNSIVRGYLGLDFYITHPYNGLDTALDLEHNPTYGKAIAPVLTNIFRKFGVEPLDERITYEYRIASNYSAPVGTYWYTSFVSFANDFTFFGVPFLIFILAYYFGNIWKDIIINRNMGAIPLLTQFVIMFFYLNANNQIIGKGQVTVFIVLFIHWKMFQIVDNKKYT